MTALRREALRQEVSAAIMHAIAERAEPSDTGTTAVRLVGTTFAGNRLTCDFSRALLDLGLGSLRFEQFLRAAHRAAADVVLADLETIEFETRIEGVPLERWFEAATRSAPQVAPWLAPTLPPDGPPRAGLAGRRVAISPGHGYYLNASNAWVLQRSYFQGIVEDFVNHDFITILHDQLAAVGADVRPTRNLDRDAGSGLSGFPRWQEAARYHIQSLGAPAGVWNEPGFDHLSQDIRCRPLYANFVAADLLVSLHNNGGGGTGTETLYDNANAAAAESKRLADLLHGKVIAAIRRDYNASWTDRRVQGFNGSYGENRLATRPAVIIEVGFMDRPAPDNAAIQDDRFKRLVAAAIAEGIAEFVDGPVPAAPDTLIATTDQTAVSLSWADRSSNETGFRVERRAEAGGTWGTLATVPTNATAYRDPTVVAGTTYRYRVLAYNDAGASTQASNEATAPTGSSTIPAPTPSGPGPGAWLSNASLRTSLAVGQNVIVGFAIDGGEKPVLLRAAGPALGAFGLATAMLDPRIELYRGTARVIDNNDWPASLAGAFASQGAFAFGTASRDAAVLQTLSGPHTAQVTGVGAGTVLVELYDAGTGSAARLINLSARNRVGTGADTLIAGFFVNGRGSKRLLVRAIGPALSAFGVTGALADPRLEIREGPTIISTNDNWDGSLSSVFAQVGAFALPALSRDSATVVDLAAGKSYTAQVSGVNNATGEALIEIYELP
ncbi:MAG: N-acetylmuramoyl-L-alanine amidase [Verrucomicrobia bacterium]|nr:N-acetylmuramoyl-L-alanine amidase [Verrucomicrobiota bacterium]